MSEQCREHGLSEYKSIPKQPRSPEQQRAYENEQKRKQEALKEIMQQTWLKEYVPSEKDLQTQLDNVNCWVKTSQTLQKYEDVVIKQQSKKQPETGVFSKIKNIWQSFQNLK